MTAIGTGFPILAPKSRTANPSGCVTNGSIGRVRAAHCRGRPATSAAVRRHSSLWEAALKLKAQIGSIDPDDRMYADALRGRFNASGRA
jgi:hypothetical protein